MREIIQHQAAYRHLLDVQHAGGGEQVLQRRVCRVECQRNKCLEAVRFVLQVAQANEMVSSVFFIFNVTVQHGGIGFQSNFMSSAGGIQPLVAVNFVVANHATDAFVENFSSATGQ